MDANTVTAICATGIAVASLAVSISQTRAVQEHNRRSVRPFLQFEYQIVASGEAGMRLRNVGLGPAIVRSTTVTLDGKHIGSWDEMTVNELRRPLRRRPRARTIHAGLALPAGYNELFIHLDNYERSRDEWFWELLRRRLVVKVCYESLYGGEQFSTRSDNPYDDQFLRERAS
ncbi:hypothetical protein KZZ52_33690 [Dactylosporangium sp. AC04546]|uniref:hypothetical protein n=1 Tax=Dactylosporangium sp. AC04546 TaxID=2862460 RepID=UPI001EE090B0|nr:hypothetical protein [Dactylosporangium sp. AC04546]WVK78928.1 hypothetical protein KZZ52_33690 [Dactylosporangium sp. AC04546]